MERKPHERLLKPPIHTVVNRKPPPWHEAHQQLIEHTREQIRLGLAPEGIERLLGSGPWDEDPAFWRSPTDRNEQTMEYEIELG